MTLRNIPYTTSSGEWLPHNAGNYTSRSKAMFFFHSFEKKDLGIFITSLLVGAN